MHRDAFTVLEVMVSTVLICIAMGNIVVMNMRAATNLKASRQVAAVSQVLQQRVEMVRELPWFQVASAPELMALMARATESEAEIINANLTETMRVTVPKDSPNGLVETDQVFSVRRADGIAVIEQGGDFTSEPTLLFQGTVTWRDGTGVHRRVLRTVICRIGLTRSGIVGTVIGRPGSRVSFER